VFLIGWLLHATAKQRAKVEFAFVSGVGTKSSFVLGNMPAILYGEILIFGTFDSSHCSIVRSKFLLPWQEKFGGLF